MPCAPGSSTGTVTVVATSTRRDPEALCSHSAARQKEFFTSAFPPTETSGTSSNGSRKLWVSRMLRNTWPKSWRRRSTSRSRRRTRRKSSSGEERDGKRSRRHLVQNEMTRRTSRPSLDMLPPRFPSASTNVGATNAYIVGLMGRDVRRGQGSTSTMRRRLLSTAATMSDFFNFSALHTMGWKLNVYTGRISFGERSMKGEDASLSHHEAHSRRSMSMARVSTPILCHATRRNSPRPWRRRLGSAAC